MKKIWLTFTSDLRRATSNLVGILVIVGLVLIPGLFSWFNIAASWDPFADTGDLTFAIASTDQGYKGDLVPLTLNLGDQVSATLLKDKRFNWVYTSKADAIDGTKSGKYYAAVVIPPSFSKDMMTFFDPAAHHAKLAYYTNEKKNALAPKLTGEGVDSVAQHINQTFSKTVWQVALNLASNLSKYLDSTDAMSLGQRLDGQMAVVSSRLRSTASGTGVYLSLLDSADSLVSSSAALLGGSAASGGSTGSSGAAAQSGKSGKSAGAATGLKAGSQEERQAIDSATSSAKSLQTAMDTAADSLSKAIAQSAGSYDSVATDVNQLFDSLGTQAGDSAASLKSLATRIGSSIADYTALRDKLQHFQDNLPTALPLTLKPLISALDNVITAQSRVKDALGQAAADITKASADTTASRQKIAALVAQAKTSLDKLHQDYDQGLGAQLTKLSGQVSSTVSSAGQLTASLDAAVADLQGSLGAGAAGAGSGSNAPAGSLTAQLSQAKSLMGTVSTSLTSAADKLDNLRDKLADAVKNKDVTALRKLIGSDPDSLAAALATPVGLSRQAVFPVANFGAAMTPLYLILPLWVGALLMGVSIRTEIEAHGRWRRAGRSGRGVGSGSDGPGRGAGAAVPAVGLARLVTPATGVSHETHLGGQATGRGRRGLSSLRARLSALTGPARRPEDLDLSPSQAYVARFGSFALISLLQSTVAALGCLLLLRVPVDHPWLFLATAWLTGLVFALIVYTLILSFGSAGKALSVLLLVVQISGAGGAYPLQTLPPFFQNVSPFLPATHAINALRAAIAGIYNGDYWVSMGQLALFIVPALLVGLLLRKPLIAVNRRFVTAVEGTKLI